MKNTIFSMVFSLTMQTILEFLNRLNQTSRGQLCLLNIVDACEIGLIESDACKALLEWWQRACLQQNIYDVGDAIDFLAELEKWNSSIDLSEGDWPNIPLPQLHIFARISRKKEEWLHDEVCSIRPAAHIGSYIDAKDYAQVLDEGLVPEAQPGSAGYTRMLMLDEMNVRMAGGERSTITNPSAGNRGVLWYAPSSMFRDKLAHKSTSPEDGATYARDVFGLVHHPADIPLVVVHMPANIVEDREDVGRPTFVDGGANERYLCRHCGDAVGKPAEWGRTIDLKALSDAADDIEGLPERICGRVPKSPFRDQDIRPTISVKALGRTNLERGRGGSEDDRILSEFVSKTFRWSQLEDLFKS